MVNELLRFFDGSTVDEVIVREFRCKALSDVRFSPEINARVWFTDGEWCKRHIVYLIVLTRETEVWLCPPPFENCQVLLRALITVVMRKAGNPHRITFFLPPPGHEIDRHTP